MSDPRRLQVLRDKFRNGSENFTVGDEVYVRCRVVGPAMLTYGEDCIALDLVVVDSTGEATGAKFTATPSEAIWPHELYPTA